MNPKITSNTDFSSEKIKLSIKNLQLMKPQIEDWNLQHST